MPLAAYIRGEQRAARVRSILRLAAPAGSQRTLGAVIVALAALGGIGAAQPVIERTRTQAVRADAQTFLVVDTSRSMLASSRPGTPTRFDRARAAAIRFRDALPEVSVGLASLTDRVLPLVFPTTSRDTIESALRLSLGVDRPPSSEGGGVLATNFGALGAVASRNFFSGPARRLVIVFTDAETINYDEGRLSNAFTDGRAELLVVRVWREGERVFGPGGAPEPYRPDPSSAASAQQLAELVEGRAFDEDEVDQALGAAREMIGEGGTVIQVEKATIEPLGPYVFLAGLIPLGFLLSRRNFA